eukprot:SAG11_NODE_27036_length_337_cov_12.962185_2_plen_22_part_01
MVKWYPYGFTIGVIRVYYTHHG